MKIYYLKSVQIVILLFFVASFGLFSCQSTTKSDTKTVQENENQEMTVSFMLSNIEDDINGAESTIKVSINEKIVEITKARNCNVLLEKEEYESKNVPLDATWACACWWAGAGNDFYAKKTDNKLEIYKKDVYEEIKTEDEKWVLFKTLD